MMLCTLDRLWLLIMDAAPWSDFNSYCLVMPYEDWVNICSVYGFLPTGTKPLPEPVLTNHHWSLLAFTWGQFHRKCSRYISLIWFWNLLIYDYSGITHHWHLRSQIKRHKYDFVSMITSGLMHKYVSKLTIIGSDDGLLPGRHQAIIWTNAGIFLIGPLATKFIEFFIEIQTFSFKKMHLNVSSAKWRSFCFGAPCVKDLPGLGAHKWFWNIPCDWL